MNSPCLLNGQICLTNQPERTAVMRVFRRKPLRYLQLREIAQEAKIAVDQAVQAIVELKEQGLRIGSRPPAEYFFEPREETLHPDLAASQLQTRWWGRRLYFGDELTSTIDAAKAILQKEENFHGAVVYANLQTQGRGRQGSVWTSPKGKDLLLTFLIGARDYRPSPSLLSLYAVTAAARVLDTAYNIPVSIKWPNDLMAHGKKIGGVLVECDLQKQAILASLGLNVHSRPSDWPQSERNRIASLAMLTQEELRRDMLLAQCGATWEALWESMTTDRGETVRGYFKHYSTTLGKRVQLLHRGRLLSGSVLNIDDVGRLLFRSDDGSTTALLVEEVQQLRLEE
ncbi:MAG: biotin--[acetyl-CoA-carboxylase] ligase [Candidatus Omnitrophica bacterium]|nr:biotin--[acetyl-CoA-carboxylase] ligase [Candidatus Omnitrophota bacterium]